MTAFPFGRRALLSSLMVVALQLVAAPASFAQDDHAGHGAGGDIYGSVHFETSCSPAVRADFDRAVAMLHSYFYPETEKAFRRVAEREPSCAMAYWGVAISQRPNPLVTPLPPALLKLGWEAIQQARAAASSGSATQRERDWIEAMALYFENADTVDQHTRTANYEAAMTRLQARYPDDREAAIFHALSMLEAVDLADKNYGQQLKAASLLEKLQKAQPEHPGIAHYLIHAYDYAPIAAKGLPAARRYAALAPSAPHALHMPSHTFSTLGMWPDAISANLAADAAQRAYATSMNPAAAEHPAAIMARYHGLDFLTNAYLQLGQDRAAQVIVDGRNSVGPLPAGAGLTTVTAFAAIPVRYAFDRGAWAEAAALAPLEGSVFKQADAVIWFGRTIGAARSGDVAAAKKSLEQLTRLHQELVAAGDPYWAEQVSIEETAGSAWIAFAEQKPEEAVTLMRRAADLEDRTEKHIAMENRLSPMRELLGELLLAEGQPKLALREFSRSLEAVPNRYRSLAGAAQAATESGNRRAARTYSRQLVTLTANADSDRPAIAVARRLVAGNSNH
jgi:tetratricopeptide (TPR) repeat protein